MIGTDQVKHKILRKLKKHNAVLKGIKYGDFADELAEEIIALFGDDMNHGVKTYARGIGIPEAIIAMCERVEKAFGFDAMGITDKDQEVYKWLIEQEATGQKIEKFVEWARLPERAAYIRKYRNSTGNIRNDWTLAFSELQSGGYDEVRF